MKQQYYSSSKIRSLDCQYNLILGERSNGKSYAIKHDVVGEAVRLNRRFILLRRWDLETKQHLIEQYFGDCNVSAITGGEFDRIYAYSKGLYLGKVDEKGKPVRGDLIGYSRALSMEEHYSSGSYPDVFNIVFEEFIARQGYLPREPAMLQQFVSTIARRRSLKVWMIGNTISRVCPYFSEWDLRNIPRQKQGSIEIYEHTTDQQDEDGTPIIIKIAVEYAENSGKNSRMFFGSSSKMITSGIWQSEEKAHLPQSIDLYTTMYDVIIEYKNFRFWARLLGDPKTRALFWYVEPYTKKIPPNTRIITDRVIGDYMATRGFIPISPAENVPFQLLRQGKIMYSDNLTGADFETCIKMLLTTM